MVTHHLWRGRGLALRTSFRYGVGAGAAAGKAIRLGEGRAWLRREVWNEGLRMAAHDLRNGYQFGAVACLLRAAGALLGAARGRRLTLDDYGRYDG